MTAACQGGGKGDDLGDDFVGDEEDPNESLKKSWFIFRNAECRLGDSRGENGATSGECGLLLELANDDVYTVTKDSCDCRGATVEGVEKGAEDFIRRDVAAMVENDVGGREPGATRGEALMSSECDARDTNLRKEDISKPTEILREL